jgi:phosphoribosyl-AMP cyclohydrolase / phosphoribosyl-ATP pyrophosphohydrolase
MRVEDIARLDWQKGAGLLPAIIQHATSGVVLMLGYMNHEALRDTLSSGLVVLFSRTRNRLWMKGETSGHRLHVVSISADCDADTILVLAEPPGPVCHLGTATCFVDQSPTEAQRLAFLNELEGVIAQRIADKPEGSYTARLFAGGPTRIAQKIGEEGVEVALAAVAGDDRKVLGESADLLYHLLLLLKSRNLSLTQVVTELASRHEQRA